MRAMLVAASLIAAVIHGAATHAAEFDGLDSSIAPGNDFFQYANGGWIKATEIPADKSSYGAFEVMADLTRQRIADLLTQTSKQKAAPGSEARKIGDYYSSFLDEAAVEAKGLAPLKPALERIAAITDRVELASALGATLRADVDVLNATHLHTDHLFGVWVAQDLDDPTRYAPFLIQGGLGMPDRDYYLNPSAEMVAIRRHYREHVAKMIKLGGFPNSVARAARIFDLERRMAAVHWTRVASEQVDKGNNHWARARFDGDAPGMDWRSFFAAAGLDGQSEFVVWQPSALVGLAQLVATVPLETWQDYLRFHALDDASAELPKRFGDAHFAFFGKVLMGTPQQRPRWKRAADATNAALGEAVGKLYVERYFSATEKARAEVMVGNILAAFGARIDHLDWMSPQTKLRAKAKLAALKVGVGYPDHWRSYESLQVVHGDVLGNVERAELFEYRRNVSKLGQPIDRAEWVMVPQLVNAVNLPVMNALNFPAAVLQTPFFDPNREAVLDYGSIGAIIGHEISHSFDDQGALFDAEGRLKNWWEPADFEHFKASGARLAAQYDAYKPFPDLAVNGAQTLSENIADLGGLNAAFDAYRLSLQHGTGPRAGSFDADQMFFLSFGQSWRDKSRDAALRDRIVTDGHAPDQYRADTVRNVDAWYAAFDVKPGQTLYLAPDDRVRVW